MFLGKSQRNRNTTEVASIACYRDGKLLWGKRRDNGKWTLPGGHLEFEESPRTAAYRELQEETGIRAEDMKFLGSGRIPAKNMVIYCYSTETQDDLDNSLDPDEECEEWQWLAPDQIPEPLHSPENVTLQLLGLQPQTLELDVQKSLAALGTAAVLSLATARAAGGTWSPEGMHPELHPIAHLESRFGQDVNHKTHALGPFHTAYGALGLKPATAHEEYRRQPKLKEAYPGLEKPADFELKFKTDPRFYNAVASAHWNYLRGAMRGDTGRTAYAWRFGVGSAKRATDNEVRGSEYVQKFLRGLMLKKSAVRLDYANERSGTDAVPLKDIHIQELGKLHEFTVWLVNGRVVRDEVDIDFTNGGNPARYQYVPENEIWVEGDNRGDISAFVVHEFTELRHMQDGDSYDTAHDKASAVERAFRGEFFRQDPELAEVQDWLSEKLIKAEDDDHWRSADGVKIPKYTNPARKDYDEKFHQALIRHFGGGNADTLVPLRITLDQLQATNRPVNTERLQMYRKMAQAGDRLPPVVVRRNVSGYTLVDGNHRLAAAREAGLPEIDAFELVKPVKKSEHHSDFAPVMFRGQLIQPAPGKFRDSPFTVGIVHTDHREGRKYYVYPEKKGITSGPIRNFEPHHAEPIRISTVLDRNHAVPKYKINQHQGELIHGIDFGKVSIEESKGVNSNYNGWHKNAAGENVFLKGPSVNNSPEREVWYHNLAHNFFKLGANVPTTAYVREPTSGVEFAAIKGVKGRHLYQSTYKDNVPDHRDVEALRQKLESGVLDKLSVMNAIIGNSDRHNSNYLIGDDGEIHLIDHGMFHPNTAYADEPQYLTDTMNLLKLERKPIHNDAVSWLRGLDATELGRIAQSMHIPEEEQYWLAERLRTAQNMVGQNPGIDIRQLLQKINGK